MRPSILLLLLLVTLPLFGQGPIGSWEDHLPYHSIKNVLAGETKIYGASDYSLIVYNKQYNEVQKLSTVQGLSESGIRTIGFSDNLDILVIAYNSTNIDLYKNNSIINIPDIYNKYIPGLKQINSISTKGKYAYLASSFGIVVVDLENIEIRDTWNPSRTNSQAEVYDLAISGNFIYASTNYGVLSADINNPGLAYYGNWIPVQGLDQNGIFSNLTAAGENLFLAKEAVGAEGDSLLLLSQGNVSVISVAPGQDIQSLSFSNNTLIVSKFSELELYDNDGQLIREIDSYGWGSPECRDAVLDGSNLYIADNAMGLVIENTNSFESIVPPGPLSISSVDIASNDANTYIASGILTGGWINTNTPFEVSVFKNRVWKTYLEPTAYDAVKIIPSPMDASSFYVSTWGFGVYQFDNTGIIEHYKESNSPLQSIIPGSDYVQVKGMSFDRDNNLWITQSGVQNSIKVLKPDKTWIVFPYTIQAPIVGDILITRSGKKWIILPNGNGLFILDDNNSPENFGDDEWIRLNVEDQYGKSLNSIFSIAEDLDGNIWIGTDQGPAIYYNPDRVFNEDLFCYRIKIPRNDGSGLADYLLGTETINNIEIDGGNRKWLGTKSSGVFLVSEDGKELIKSYSVANSPLLSDTITALGIDDVTGELWIGTSKGIISVREEATGGEDGFEKVYAFPNPVRPEFSGPVTITGLARNTNVKITDVSGNLVYETTSTGGQAIWDLRNYKHQRVSTGVYLAFCSTESGETSEVIKILIVR